MSYKDERGCLDRIRDLYTSLNSAEKKVAKFILENSGDIIHLSITELADNSSVSDATVTRLCKKLNYKGYQELKINLAGDVVEPIKNIHQEINENDDMYMIMHKILNSNIHSMENTIKINDSRALDDAVRLITKAENLLFYGMGGSGAIAHDAYHKFVRTGIRCTVHVDSHWQAMSSSMAGENDVIIAISNSGSNKDLIESIEIGKNNGVKVISITGNAKSPISRVSDIVLVSYGRESLFRSEAMDSRTTALMLIDCLYIGVALKRKDETLRTLDKIRNGIATKRY